MTKKHAAPSRVKAAPSRTKKAAALTLSILALSVAAPRCSTGNHEGPDPTCQDLQCGRINACNDGIIASCLDGKTVKWHVCLENARDICDEDWQTVGQFKCEETQPDCESCAPLNPGCGEASSSSSSSSSNGAGGAGGST